MALPTTTRNKPGPDTPLQGTLFDTSEDSPIVENLKQMGQDFQYIDVQTNRQRTLEVLAGNLSEASVQQCIDLVIQLDAAVLRELPDDVKAFFFLGLGLYANQAYMRFSRSGLPEYRDSQTVLPQLLRAGITDEAAGRLTDALNQGNPAMIRAALDSAPGLYALTSSFMDMEGGDAGLESIKPVVSVSTDATKQDKDIYVGLVEPTIGLSYDKDQHWVFAKKKQLFDILRTSSVRVHGFDKELKWSVVTATEMVNLLFAYFDQAGMRQVRNVIHQINQHGGNPAELVDVARRNAESFVVSCSVLSALWSTYPGDLTQKVTAEPIDEMNKALAARRHYGAIRNTLHALTTSTSDIWKAVNAYNISTKSRKQDPFDLLAELFKCGAGSVTWSHDSIVKHIRIACFYGSLAGVCDSLLLLQPQGTHDRILKIDVRLLQGTLQVYSQVCGKILNYLAPVGEHLLNDIVTMGGDQERTGLRITKLAVGQTHGRFRTIEDIMTQIENVYGSSNRAPKYEETESDDEESGDNAGTPMNTN